MKRKVLACVLACAMLFLGMGYAYWTDSLQIDTAVTTGELNVKFIDLALYGQYGAPDNEGSWAIINGVNDPDDFFFGRGTNYHLIADEDALEEYFDDVEGYTQTTFGASLANPGPLGVTIEGYGENTPSSSKINININDIYPGYAQVFQADIANAGTLAAKLSDIVFTMNNQPNDDVKDMIGVSLRVLREYADTPTGTREGHIDVFSTGGLFTDDDIFTLGGVDFVRLSALEGQSSGALENDLLYVLPDKNRMDVYLGIAMDPDAEGKYTSGKSDLATADPAKDNATENKAARFSLTFLWDQFNVDHIGPDSHNHLE